MLVIFFLFGRGGKSGEVEEEGIFVFVKRRCGCDGGPRVMFLGHAS